MHLCMYVITGLGIVHSNLSMASTQYVCTFTPQTLQRPQGAICMHVAARVPCSNQAVSKLVNLDLSNYVPHSISYSLYVCMCVGKYVHTYVCKVSRTPCSVTNPITSTWLGLVAIKHSLICVRRVGGESCWWTCVASVWDGRLLYLVWGWKGIFRWGLYFLVRF